MTLGCKVNQFETETMEGLFRARGYEIVPFEEAAEVYVINTCSVTHLSDRKSRQLIRRAARTTLMPALRLRAAMRRSRRRRSVRSRACGW